MCLPKDVWACRFFQRNTLCPTICIFLLPCELVSWAVLLFSFFLGKTIYQVFFKQHWWNRGRTKHFIKGHFPHRHSAIQKEGMHFKYVVNTFESALLSVFVVICRVTNNRFSKKSFKVYLVKCCCTSQFLTWLHNLAHLVNLCSV